MSNDNLDELPIWYVCLSAGGAMSDGTPQRTSEPTTRAAAQSRADELNRYQDPFSYTMYIVCR